MSKYAIAVATILTLAATAPVANAKGCVKGAIVGGVAGHYVGSGHGVLGATAGCVVGRHYANKQARQQQSPPQTTRTNYGSSQ